MSDLRQQKSRSVSWEPLLAGIVMLTAFAYTVIRSYRVPLFHDEAASFFISTQPLQSILRFAVVQPSNHLLNTLLVKCSHAVFGYTEIVLRLPALLGHALYLTGIYKTLRMTISKQALRVMASVPLFLNPFLLELFSSSRGYALALGFLSWGVYFYLHSMRKQADQRQQSDRSMSVVMLMFAVLSNMSFLHVYLTVLAIFAVLDIKNWRADDQPIMARLRRGWQRWRVMIMSVVVLIVILAGPVIKLKRNNRLFYGGQHGFWHDTVTSLIKSTLYGQPYESDGLVLLLKIGIMAAVMAGAGWLFFQKIRKQQREQQNVYLFSVLVLMAACAGVIWLQFILIHTRFVVQRTASFFIPLFLLSLFMLLDDVIRNVKTNRIKFCVLGGMMAVVLFAGGHFVKSFNIRNHYVCPYAGGVKSMMREVYELVADKNLPERSVSVGTHWPLCPVINYYRFLFGMNWLQDTDWNGPDRDFDCYFLALDAKLFSQKDIDDQKKLMEKYQLIRVMDFPEAGVYLAVPARSLPIFSKK